jgi:cation diffusion facilitator family transporter
MEHLQHDEGHRHEIEENSRRTLVVTVVTATMMVVEIAAGMVTGSMALLADGWHMASHVAAFLVSWLAYKAARSERLRLRFTFGTGKVLSLGGYTSAVILAVVAVVMATESLFLLVRPEAIQVDQALAVTAIGLLVNVVCAMVLARGHHHIGHDHAHVDRNLKSAYVHVLTDMLTSVLAVLALAGAKYLGWSRLDPLVGVLGAVIVGRWAWDLCRESAAELLDVHPVAVPVEAIRELFASDGVRVVDAHVWRIGAASTACELVVEASFHRGAAYYRDKLRQRFSLQHVIVEEVVA